MLSPRYLRLWIAPLLVLASAATCSAGSGLLGTRYLQAAVLGEHVRTFDTDDGLGLAALVNLPVGERIDVLVEASHLAYDDFDFRENRLNTTLRLHSFGRSDLSAAVNFRPFVDFDLGYSSQSSVIGGIHYDNDEVLYGAGAGFELSGERTSLVLAIARTEWADQELDGYYTYHIGLNRWLTPRLNLGGSITFLDDETITYRVGCSVRF